jgi:hypothetical protein
MIREKKGGEETKGSGVSSQATVSGTDFPRTMPVTFTSFPTT